MLIQATIVLSAQKSYKRLIWDVQSGQKHEYTQKINKIITLKYNKLMYNQDP